MASRAMSGRPATFGLLEKTLRFRIMASAGSWNTPVVVGGRGTGTAPGVASVSRAAAGKFLVTLEDGYAKLVTAHATYQGSGDAEDLVAQIGVPANVGTSTPVLLMIKTKAGAANTDPATTDANTAIHVDLTFEDSSG